VNSVMKEWDRKKYFWNYT